MLGIVHEMLLCTRAMKPVYTVDVAGYPYSKGDQLWRDTCDVPPRDVSTQHTRTMSMRAMRLSVCIRMLTSCNAAGECVDGGWDMKGVDGGRCFVAWLSVWFEDDHKS